MELESIGTVIAERTYQLEGGGNVLVRVGMPALFPEGGNHYCPFDIEGLYANTMISRAGGVDSVQALVLALQKIRTILEHSELPVPPMPLWNLGTGLRPWRTSSRSWTIFRCSG